MIIFETILNTFIAIAIFRGVKDSDENWLEVKIEPQLACLKSMKVAQ
jgi:hypothetical protein